MEKAAPSVPPPGSETPPTRRGFLAKISTVVIGFIVAAVPFAVGLAAIFDPLRRKNRSAGEFVRVASLDAVPTDGLPRRFSVFADRTDAWSHYPQEAVGAVYLRRTDSHVEALNMICPHLGCPVELDSATQCFKCPCHNSAFSVAGDVLYGPSPRPMDSLAVELRGADDGKEVWVKFENFYTAISEKIPIV